MMTVPRRRMHTDAERSQVANLTKWKLITLPLPA